MIKELKNKYFLKIWFSFREKLPRNFDKTFKLRLQLGDMND